MQAQQTITNFPLANEWGEKHKLFVTWKYIESKVYHASFLQHIDGLSHDILDHVTIT